MSASRVYLNHALTWPLEARARQRMADLLAVDPDRPDRLISGPRLADVVEQARLEVASLIGAAADEILFTSGGTEACNLALKGIVLPRLARKEPPPRILVAATDRPSVVWPARSLARLGADLAVAPVDPDGLLDPDQVRTLLGGVSLVSIPVADEETGTRQPVAEIAALARARGALVHADACVAAGYLTLDVRTLGVDLLSLSGHRMGGPAGAGALFVRRGVTVAPQIEGSAAEGGRRGGALSAGLLAAFGAAASIRMEARESEQPRMEALGRRLLSSLAARDRLRLNGHPERRIQAFVNVSCAGVDGEAVVLKLARRGVAASTGSLCAQEAGKPSAVLAAMGVPEDLSRGSVLFSLGPSTTSESIDRAAAMMAESLDELRRLAPHPA